MRGRPRDPTRATRRTGHRRKPDEAPALSIVPALPPEAGPQPPEDLPQEAKDLWTQLVQMMTGVAPIRPADAIMLEQIVRQYQRAKQAGAMVDKYGVIHRNASGDVVGSPFVKMEREAAALLHRFCQDYGLTLAARLRLGLMQLQGKTMLQSLNEDLEQ